MFDDFPGAQGRRRLDEAQRDINKQASNSFASKEPAILSPNHSRLDGETFRHLLILRHGSGNPSSPYPPYCFLITMNRHTALGQKDDEPGGATSNPKVSPNSTPPQGSSTSSQSEWTEAEAIPAQPVRSNVSHAQVIQSFQIAHGHLWTPPTGEGGGGPPQGDIETSDLNVQLDGSHDAASMALSCKNLTCSDQQASGFGVAHHAQLSDDNRSRSLPNVMHPFAMKLSTDIGTDVGDLRHARSLDALVGASTPVCSFSPYDGRPGPVRPAGPWHDAEVQGNSEHQGMGSSTTPVSTRHDDQDLRHDFVTLRVETLNLAAFATAGHSQPYHDLGSFHGDTFQTAPEGSGKSRAAFSAQHDLDSMLHAPRINVGSRQELSDCQAAMDPEHNPMWGLTHNFNCSSLESDARDWYVAGPSGHESMMTTPSTGGLDPFQWLQDSAWQSNDSWAHRNGEEHSHDDLIGLQGRTAEDHHAMLSMQQRLDSVGSGLNQCSRANISRGQGTAPQATSFAALGSTSVTTVGNHGAGRMEEGCIGSKRRIWYRAPNGQFAPATQAFSGQSATNGHASQEQPGSGSGSSIRRIRRRRKSEEVDRKYRCDFEGCDKAYGTLNHLNTHRATNEHGPRLNAVTGERLQSGSAGRISEQASRAEHDLHMCLDRLRNEEQGRGEGDGPMPG